eukprot:TRINITY_DN36562_c0_g1_i2.p1 TRINITY_DN36562_c0_g1~~TRINITY_DN36562_c0_g1_i2.p1  ORF type:complete len:306 (-),score=45.18 TRINITY_DN36562_c0_g1_i2:265-1182(-)
MKTSFLLAAVITIASVAVTCFYVAEPSHQAVRSKGPSGSPSAALRDSTICGTYLLTAAAWGGWISLQVYGSHFSASEVFGGSADPRQILKNQRFIEGSRAASAGMAANTMLMTLAAFCLTSMNKYFGRRMVWSGSMLFAGLLLCLSFPIGQRHATTGVQVWLMLFGPAFAVQCALPFDIIASRAPSHLKGALLGYLNWAVCLPQLVMSLIGGPLVSHFGTDVAAFAFGAACLLLASFAVWTVLPADVDGGPAVHSTSPSTSGQSSPPGTPVSSAQRQFWPFRKSRQAKAALVEPLLPRFRRNTIV